MLKLLAPLVLVSAGFAQDYYSAALDGSQEVPPVATAGRGWGIVRHDPATNGVRIFVFHEGLSAAPTAAHLHLAPAGANGGIIVPLAASGANAFSGIGVLTAAQATALASSGTYLNVHTPLNLGGEIRGQVVASVSTRYTAVLSGAQEVPPNASIGTGTAVAYLHEPENRVVYVVNSSGLLNVTAGHFHQQVAGSNGPVIIGFNGSGGTYCGVSEPLTPAQVAAWQANGVYANVHTAALPGGEIRGQMLKDQGDHFVAELSSAQTVPNTGSPGLGRASLVRAADGTLTLTGAFAGLTGAPTVAHVHLAPPGANGGVVFPLTIGAGTLTGSFLPSTAQLADLRAGNWYVNLHSTVNPPGEIRGQLNAASLPTTYGCGCRGSNGQRPQIGATGFASVGSSFSVDLYGAVPGAIALFAFGSNRDSFGGVIPLPLALTTAGINAPNCLVLVDPTVINVVFGNALGCASQTINIPFVPGLRGSEHYSQWFVLDGAANPGGFVASSALSFTVQ